LVLAYGLEPRRQQLLASACRYDTATWKACNGLHTGGLDKRDLNITDPANKIIYEAHLYFDEDGSGTYAKTYDQQKAYPTWGVDKVQPFLKWLQQKNAKGFIGEFVPRLS
jgi:hypothetical protein